MKDQSVIDVIGTMAKNLETVISAAQTLKESNDESDYNKMIQSITDPKDNYIIINTLNTWLKAAHNDTSFNQLVVDLYKRKCTYVGELPSEANFFIESQDSPEIKINSAVAVTLPTGIFKLWNLLNENPSIKQETQEALKSFSSLLRNYLANPKYLHTVSAEEETSIVNELISEFSQQRIKTAAKPTFTEKLATDQSNSMCHIL